MTRPVLSLANIEKSYGRLKALDDVSLTIHCGEFVSLLGPNGAGKTTLFQLLSGLFVPDAGSIQVDGKDLRGAVTEALANLGIVFQQATLDLDTSVAANLRFHARLHGMGKRMSERIPAELERLGLADNANTLCRALSGGNRRRVELARALLHQPKLLLMDEPTVGLDPGSRKSLVDYVHELCTVRGTAVLWATHLVDEAENADRVIVLNKGRVLTDGEPGALVDGSGERDLAAAFLKLTESTRNEGAK